MDDYRNIYKEICQIVGEENMLKIYLYFKGTNIHFPKSLYSSEYLREYIYKNWEKMGIKNIAKKFDLTERRVRQILKEKIENERKKL